MAGSYWPSMTDYQEALQSPAITFTSPQLKAAAPVENNLGLPRPICGSFASVYELVYGRRRWAVKCFLRNTPDLHKRYARIADHLRKHRRLRYFVRFEYQEQAIRVRGELFPLVKMEWIEGAQLNAFIEQNLTRPKVLAKLKKRWETLLKDLSSARIAHGDLQHGNILVLPSGELRLIDYDGMWVPALEGERSNETGHQDFQNPGRTQRDFHAGIDEFSAAVVNIAIAALGREPALWAKYNNGDNLLFRRRDFLDPENSPLIADLKRLNLSAIRKPLDFVVDACLTAKRRAAKRRARSGKVAANAGASAGAPPAAAWLSDHVEDYATARPQRRSAAPARAAPVRRRESLGMKLFRWLLRP